MQTQPCMMTLKQFLATQDDSISDSDAITKYNEYKLEFRRQQMNEFFVAHKDEEWYDLSTILVNHQSPNFWTVSANGDVMCFTVCVVLLRGSRCYLVACPFAPHIFEYL